MKYIVPILYEDQLIWEVGEGETAEEATKECLVRRISGQYGDEPTDENYSLAELPGLDLDELWEELGSSTGEMCFCFGGEPLTANELRTMADNLERR